MKGLLPRRVLPVLMYHRIGSAAGSEPSLFVSRHSFSRQLHWLKDHGFETVSIENAVEIWSRGKVPKRTVLITFDDAFADTLDVAAAALADCRFTATVFAPSALLGQEVELRSQQASAAPVSRGRIASETELRDWVDRGFDLGSHSSTHADLVTEPASRVVTEMIDSKRWLEERVGHPIEDFCYPYAHHNAMCRKLAQRCGYRSAFAGEPPIRDLYAIPRMMVYPEDSMDRFRRKVSGFYYWASIWHRRLTFGGRQAQSRGVS
ncbi:MAG: polysaccharide deacetylase family protein [Acidobacteriota bacterium]